MLLAFDIGNTETTAGLFRGDILVAQWRLTTSVPRTSDEMHFQLNQLVSSANAAPGEITAVAIASVVPNITPVLATACRRSFGVDALIIDADSPLPIRLAVDVPATTGADRIVNTLAASRIYQRDAIIVDLGTATTYDCITADGTFLGGVIQPGVITSSESLIRRTAQLPAAALVPPQKVIGTNTVECIQAGVVFGSADAIDGIIRRIKCEWPTSSIPFVIATGGLGETFRAICEEIEATDPALTLRGVQLAHVILS